MGVVGQHLQSESVAARPRAGDLLKSVRLPRPRAFLRLERWLHLPGLEHGPLTLICRVPCSESLRASGASSSTGRARRRRRAGVACRRPRPVGWPKEAWPREALGPIGHAGCSLSDGRDSSLWIRVGGWWHVGNEEPCQAGCWGPMLLQAVQTCCRLFGICPRLVANGAAAAAGGAGPAALVRAGPPPVPSRLRGGWTRRQIRSRQVAGNARNLVRSGSPVRTLTL